MSVARLPCASRSRPATRQPVSLPSALASPSKRSTSRRSAMSLRTARTRPINQQTVLTPAQETVVLQLDDVTREFICPHASRSGLDRRLHRHREGNLNALRSHKPAVVHKALRITVGSVNRLHSDWLFCYQSAQQGGYNTSAQLSASSRTKVICNPGGCLIRLLAC